jgi:hypothetical protein
MKHLMDSLSEELFCIQGSPASVIPFLCKKLIAETPFPITTKKNEHEDL